VSGGEFIATWAACFALGEALIWIQQRRKESPQERNNNA
jgi:hypothetical protein